MAASAARALSGMDALPSWKPSRVTSLPGAAQLAELSLRDIAVRLVIATGKKKGQHPSPATVPRMLPEHDGKAAAAAAG